MGGSTARQPTAKVIKMSVDMVVLIGFIINLTI